MRLPGDVPRGRNRRAGDEPGAAGRGWAASAEAVLAGADRRPAAGGVPRRPGDVGVHRDDLSVAVCAIARRTPARLTTACAPGGRRHPARRPGGGEPDSEHGQHQRAAGGADRPGGAWALGGRPDHRQAQPDRDRHPGRTLDRVHDAGPPARRVQARAGHPALYQIKTLPRRCAGR